MCGITGWITARTPIERPVLERMRDSLAHRGPDDADLWISENGTAGLGHRRLTFLDLGQTGRQPMARSKLSTASAQRFNSISALPLSHAASLN